MVSRWTTQLLTITMKLKNFSKVNPSRNYGVYEPDYLEAMKSKIPLYPTLNIQLRGYDFPVLENYQSFLHKTLTAMDVEVEDGWATPCRKFRVERLKPRSSAVDAEYHLSIYERNIQISSPENTILPLVLQMCAASLPEGVELQVLEHLPEHEEMRYVPDSELKDLKKQLEAALDKKKKS